MPSQLAAACHGPGASARCLHLRRRILRAFVGRGLLESFEAKEMLGYRHSGFSVDTSVCIAAHDRAGLERLLRYCARPTFAIERLRKAGAESSHRTSHRHAGHRCGTSLMHTMMRVSSQRRAGTIRRKRRQTLSLISASIGERAGEAAGEPLERRFLHAAGNLRLPVIVNTDSGRP